MAQEDDILADIEADIKQAEEESRQKQRRRAEERLAEEVTITPEAGQRFELSGIGLQIEEYEGLVAQVAKEKNLAKKEEIAELARRLEALIRTRLDTVARP